MRMSKKRKRGKLRSFGVNPDGFHKSQLKFYAYLVPGFYQLHSIYSGLGHVDAGWDAEHQPERLCIDQREPL